MKLPFLNRSAAGQVLANKLESYTGRDDVVVLALPRGVVPVAVEVARALGAELDLMIVRKLGTPGQEELAMGAVASGQVRVMNRSVVESLGVSPDMIEAQARREQREVRRRELAYRGDRPPVDLEGKCVLLVDDGVATGASIRAAIQAVRSKHPASVIVAIPVAPADTLSLLREEADEVVCLVTPEPFLAIGQWYYDFTQVEDDEVQETLQKHWQTQVTP